MKLIHLTSLLTTGGMVLSTNITNINHQITVESTTKSHYDIFQQGKTTVWTKWYYFLGYIEVSLNHQDTNELQTIYEKSDQDATRCVRYLIDKFTNLNYLWFANWISLPAEYFGLATRLTSWKPWTYDQGEGITWGQTFMGTITKVWAQ